MPIGPCSSVFKDIPLMDSPPTLVTPLLFNDSMNNESNDLKIKI